MYSRKRVQEFLKTQVFVVSTRRTGPNKQCTLHSSVDLSNQYLDVVQVEVAMQLLTSSYVSLCNAGIGV